MQLLVKEPNFKIGVLFIYRSLIKDKISFRHQVNNSDSLQIEVILVSKNTIIYKKKQQVTFRHNEDALWFSQG